MKTIKLCLWVFLIVSIASCVKDHIKTDYTALLNNIPEQKYYTSDTLTQEQQFIYGTWKIIGTSGGFAGSGFTPGFEYLVTKPNGIYGLVANDSLLLYGKILLVKYPNAPAQSFSIRFIPDPNTSSNQIGNFVPEGTLTLRSDTLDIMGPCCDYFDAQFIRIE